MPIIWLLIFIKFNNVFQYKDNPWAMNILMFEIQTNYHTFVYVFHKLVVYVILNCK